MRALLATLVAALGLGASAARAQEKLTVPPTPVPQAAPADKPTPPPAAGSVCSCGTSCSTCRKPWDWMGWLTYCPPMSSCHYLTGVRPTQLYAYFMCYPCHEGCGATCANPACASCGGCGGHR